MTLHELLLLAHRKSVAMKTAGLEELDGPGGGSAAQVARLADRLARGQLRGPDAEHAIRDVERLLLRRLALEPDGAAVADVCEKHRLEPRWLRGAAYSVLRAVGLALAGRDAATMAEATEFLRGALDRIAAPGEGPWPKSVKALVPLRTPEATITLRKRAGAGIQATLAHTIHSVKGSESAAALVVLSNARGANLGALLDAWETRAELEAKRVAYVAMTRAELVVGIAVPGAFRDRLVRILTAGNVPYRMAGDASRSGRG